MAEGENDKVLSDPPASTEAESPPPASTEAESPPPASTEAASPPPASPPPASPPPASPPPASPPPKTTEPEPEMAGDNLSIFAPTPAPSIWLCIQRGFDAYKKAAFPMSLWALGIAGLVYVVGLVTMGFGLIFLTALLWVPLTLGYYQACYESAKGAPVTIGTMFAGFTNPQAYLLSILCSFMVLFVALITCLAGTTVAMSIPVYCCAAMVGREKSAVDSIKYALRFMKNNFVYVLIIGVLAFGIQSIGQLTWVLNALFLPLAICMQVACFEMMTDPGDDAEA